MTGQNAVMLAALKQGPRTSAELSALGVGRPNSRAADLNERGHRVECRFNANAKGAARYVYHLLTETGPSADVPGGLQGDPVSVSRQDVVDLDVTGTAPAAPLAGAEGTYPSGTPREPVRPACSPSAGDSTGGHRHDERPAGLVAVAPADVQGVDPGIPLRQLSLLEAVA